MTSVIEQHKLHNSTSCKWLVYQLEVIFPLIYICNSASSLHMLSVPPLSASLYNLPRAAFRRQYLVKGQRKFILVVKSQSKNLAGQHFDRGWRLEYRIYRSVTPLSTRQLHSRRRISCPLLSIALRNHYNVLGVFGTIYLHIIILGLIITLDQ